MIEKIKTAIKDDSLVIFVGAGMSMPFGFPSWTRLVQNILKDIKDDGPFNFPYYLKQGDNINIFKALNELEHKEYNSRVKISLNKEITSIKVDESKLGKHKKLWELCDKIITTNYDKVLEKPKPEGVVVFSNGNEFQQSQSIKGNPFLYKIHGDIDNPDTCILFESDYKKLYKEGNSDLKTFDSLLLNKTILFIGFSLKDPFVANQMEYLSNLYKGYNQEHYILQEIPEDFSKYNVKSISIENWNDGFDAFLDELIETKRQSSQVIPKQKEEEVKVDISKITDMVVLEKMLEEKKQEFESADESEKRKFSKEMHSVSNRMQELFAQKLQINFSQELPEHKEGELAQLFDTIFQSEKLNPQTIQKIEEVRNQHSESYQWYQRSLILSAIACSLINHKKLDPKKIDLLVDFTNDSEDKVWQKAITYLFLILNHLGNKWLRFGNLKPKLETLKANQKIQEALRDIIVSLQMGFQNVSVVSERIFENQHFRDSPFNYFTPFYKGNPSIDKVYEDDSLEDVEDYIELLHNLPLPDSFKYLLCLSEKVKNENEKKSISVEEKKSIDYTLSVHRAFEPYLNYINEFINFYMNYPNLNKEINQKTTIVGFKKFKTHLLNAEEHHRAMGRQFMLESSFGKAITHYEQILVTKPSDENALSNLITCLESIKNNEEAILKSRLDLEKINAKDHDNLNRISLLYHKKKKFKTAIKYSDKAISLDSKTPNYYNRRAISKDSMKDYQGAIKDYDKAITLDPKDPVYYFNRAGSKDLIKDYKGAIEDCDKAIALNPKNGDYYKNRADFKDDLKDYRGAIKDYDKAIALNPKDAIYYSSKANSLRKEGEFEKAFIVIEEGISIDKKESRLYGTKATIYASKGNDDEFYNYLEKAFQLKAKAEWLDYDIKEKYKNDIVFKELLKKYNQKLI